MKKLVAILILMLLGMLGYTGVNLNRTFKKAHAFTKEKSYKKGDFECPTRGGQCLGSLPPVVIK